MNETFTIGCPVVGPDGVCGQLKRVVVQPLTGELTHLVVEATHRLDIARLVPIGLVESAGDEVRLRCPATEYVLLDEAEETTFVPRNALAPTGEDEYGDQAVYWPYYALGGGMTAGLSENAMIGNSGAMPMGVTHDRVPLGEVEVRRGQHVHATDGNIGRVRGLVVDAADHHVTHVLLDEGHLWGRKRVAIPIGSVERVDDGVRLTLSKDEVRDLPAVDVADPAATPEHDGPA